MSKDTFADSLAVQIRARAGSEAVQLGVIRGSGLGYLAEAVTGAHQGASPNRGGQAGNGASAVFA